MSLLTIPAFVDAENFHVVIESPRGTSLKLKYDERLQAMGISRPLPIGLVFPFDWGFVPSTRGPDGDPLDAFVMWDVAAFPGVVVVCRAVGVLRIEQNASNFDASKRQRNDRVLGVPVAARRQAEWRRVTDIPERVREECVEFTRAAGALEGKDVAILGWGAAEEALALIRASG